MFLTLVFLRFLYFDSNIFPSSNISSIIKCPKMNHSYISRKTHLDVVFFNSSSFEYFT